MRARARPYVCVCVTEPDILSLLLLHSERAALLTLYTQNTPSARSGRICSHRMRLEHDAIYKPQMGEKNGNKHRSIGERTRIGTSKLDFGRGIFVSGIVAILGKPVQSGRIIIYANVQHSADKCEAGEGNPPMMRTSSYGHRWNSLSLDTVQSIFGSAWLQ